MPERPPVDVNQQVIEEFRANEGRVGGPFEGARLILLTTTGARTGTRHTTPVAFLPDGERLLVIASAAGAPRHPAWFHNLCAHPRVTVEDGLFTYEADAVVLEGEERDVLFARACEADQGWAGYQARTDRVLPVVALEAVPGPPDFGNRSPGAALKAVHDAFRYELARVRREVAEAGPGGLGAQLRVNCLIVCQGLHHHHVTEDAGMFAGLAAQRPELAPTLELLRREHEEIAALLAELQGLVSAGAGSDGRAGSARPDPARVLAEVDRLTRELEAHLAHEEQELLPVLDAFAPPRG
ncbi:nitroreductase/quinone reductase family protein [Streptomyces sp. DSM 42041]|uniref:Nitroreductase/quinone reductase family protein n=1 Tax=Streptomyces hazeniae TaxID=3075538 RepID=A0ABU2P0H9_9ACTN|nr:nitroreductase/quinone reductase family protein [Streptomyces sp. DSM 42041]MDT0381968.1 nitroreductase/quinone reductase family protein [Streptomyces sp. DSM 42041]